MIEVMLPYFSSYVASISTAWILGQLLLSFFIQNSFKGRFLYLLASLLTGIIALVCLYSFAKTTFDTINLSFIWIVLVSHWVYDKSLFFRNYAMAWVAFKKHFSILSWLIVISIGLVLFSFYSIYVFDPESYAEFKLPHVDIIFNAKISEYISITGIENIWQVNCLLDYDFQSNTPYHFFELWLNAFCADVFGLLHVATIPLVSQLMLHTTFAIALFACIEAFKKKVFWGDALLVVLLIGFKGVFTIDFLQGIDYFWNSIFDSPKLSTIYVFWAASLAFYLNGRFRIGVIVLLCLPFVYITVAPSVLSGVFLTTALLYIFKKDLRGDLKPILWLSIAVGGFIAVYYTAHFITAESVSIAFEKNIPEGTYLKTSINIVGATGLQTLLLLSPVLPFIFFHLYKNRGEAFFNKLMVITIYTLSITGVGLLAWAMLHKLADAPQLYQNTGVPLINVSVTVLLLYLYATSTRKWIIIALSIILLANAYNSCKALNVNGGGLFDAIASSSVFSNDYLREIDTVLKSNTLFNPVGVSMFDSTDYDRSKGGSYYISNPFSVNTNTAVLGAQLKLLKPYFNTICISPHEIPNWASIYVDSGIKSSLFYRYVEKQKALGVFVSLTKSRIDFIKKHQIRYMIVSKNVHLPIEFVKMTNKEIVDSLSGERFLLLDY